MDLKGVPEELGEEIFEDESEEAGSKEDDDDFDEGIFDQLAEMESMKD